MGSFQTQKLREIYQRFLESRISISQTLLEKAKGCKCEQAGGAGCACEEGHVKSRRLGSPATGCGSSTSSGFSPTNSISSEEEFWINHHHSTSVAQVQDNVSTSTILPLPPRSLHVDRLEMERPLGSSTPEVRDHTDSSGRSSPSSQSESSGYSTSSTTPFDSFIFDETDSISCHVANGYLLLITNMWDLQHPEPRIGTKEDSEQVERFFRRAGFTVKKLYNQSKDQMEKEFKSLVQTTQLCDYDCFTLVIMSHGSEKGILGKCGKPYDVDKIVDLFKGDSCPALLTKPKLFFIQACRGDKTDMGQVYARRQAGYNIRRDGPVKKTEPPTIRLPTDSDILVAYSTTEGRPAHRYVDWSKGRPTGGSWFISCMMQVFNVYGGKEDLMTMLVRVNKAISKYGDNDKQIPCQVSMLTKKIYFTLEAP